MSATSRAPKTLLSGRDDLRGIDNATVIDAIERAQRNVLQALIKQFRALCDMRIDSARLIQLSGDIEAVARRNGWTASADLGGPLRTLLVEDLRHANRELLDAVVTLIELAALRPREDWTPIITTTRIAIGVALERRGKR